MEEQIRRRIKKAIREKLFPGCVVGVVTKKGSRFVLSAGRHAYKFMSPSVRPDSIFDVASITKAIPLAVAALALIEEGKLLLESPIVSLLPKFDTTPQKRKVTILHLLTNTIDLALPPLSSLKDINPALIAKRVCEAPLVAEPGTTYRYTNASSLLLSLCLTRVAQPSLGVFAKKLFFNPLSMRDTTFDLFIERINVGKRVIPSEIDPWRDGEIRGKVHDESTHTLQKLYGVNKIGTAGLFSTVPDLLTFLEMLLNNGFFRGHRYFSEEMVTQMSVNHFPLVEGADGLGWALYPQEYMGNYSTAHTFGKTGFTGCMVLADRKKEVGLVVLSNYHYPHRKKDLVPNIRFRADIADIVFCNSK